MGLISGMMIGIIFGIGVMFAWRRRMRYRRLKRVAKAAAIKFLGTLNRDDLKKLCGDTFPEWISFSVFEQVKWLNKQISKSWPFVSEAAGPLIIYYVEPMLEAYRPPGIKSIKFSKIFLGNVPPKIEGIRVHSLKKGQIIMDIDFRWGGNLSIVLAVDSLVASLPIQLKDLQVFTLARVVFHLTEEIPCISALVAALLSEPKPRIEYTLKAIGGSLTSIPGISDMIDDIMQNIVTDVLEWPRRIVVPIGVGVDTSELELRPQGELTVTVVKARELKNMEKLGISDPYVVLHIRPLFKVKTKVVDNNLNPVWGESFRLIVEDKETQAVVFQVFDEDITQDKTLGIVKLPLINLEPEIPTELELKLLPALDMTKIKDKHDRGTLTIKALYHEFNKQEQLAAMKEEKEMLESRQKLKEAGVIGSTMEALDGAASLVSSGAGLVGSGLVAGVGLVGSGFGKAVRLMSKTLSNKFGGSSSRKVIKVTPTPEDGATASSSLLYHPQRSS